MNFLIEYGLFLAKALTIVIAFIVIVAAIVSIATRGKEPLETLNIENVNEELEEIRDELQAETLSKDDYKKWQKSLKKPKKETKRSESNSRLFVMRYEGDVKASLLDELSRTISAIIEVALPEDEVLLVLESGGGFVHSYGLAASQLHRLRLHKIPLTVAIDRIAASGGYMMAAVANKIIAAPFAIVGSIGVVAQLPNFHKLLKKHHIDYELHTAGEYKRTLTVFGENTEEDREKFQEELEDTQILFKEHLTEHRPQLPIDKVATGEHWHAKQALEYQLIDEIQTSDEFILQKTKTMNVYEVNYEIKVAWSDKLINNFAAILTKCSSLMRGGH